MTEGVNDGIARAHRDGVVTSTSLMVDAPAAEHAVGLTRRLARLAVGLHFVEPADADIDDELVLTAVLERQLERFAELVGRMPTHLDSHHHVHLQRSRTPTFATAAARLGIPLRGDGSQRYIGGFWGQREPGVTDLTHVRPAYLDRLLREEVGPGVNELACHPAASIDDLHSTYRTERLVELDTLTRPGLRHRIAQLGITLVGPNAREPGRRTRSPAH